MHCLMRNVLFFVFVLIGNFVVVFFWVQKLFDWKEMYIPNNFWY